MQRLSEEFLATCPEHQGFRLRGLDMTRIEVLVDAAFAFAITLLVISFDTIPANFDEMVTALKNTPAFVVAVAQLVWIWHAHNTWSRRFGLEDAMTVALSGALLIVVLVYIYPLRIMAQGMFSWFSGGWLPSSFEMQSLAELRFMFTFLGIGFTLLCGLFVAFYAHAGRCAEALGLSASEEHHRVTVQWVWTGASLIGALAVILAVLLPDRWVPFSGFAYALLGVVLPVLEVRRARRLETLVADDQFTEDSRDAN